MNKYIRRIIIGLLSGFLSSTLLYQLLRQEPYLDPLTAARLGVYVGTVLHRMSLSAVMAAPLWIGVGLGCLMGVGYALMFRPTPRAYADNMIAGAALGVPMWTILSVVVLPWLTGQPPRWTVEGMHDLFPNLVGWMVYGDSLGLTSQVLNDLTFWCLGVEPMPRPAPVTPKQIVIVGGGFAGVATAEKLERLFGADRSVAFTLVSEANALLFTPMLAEVAAGSLEPTHISTPLRTRLKRTTIVQQRVAAIDVEKRRIRLTSDPLGSQTEANDLPYDHLVLALGSVSNYLGMKGVEENAFGFKSLPDAMRIRNHVIAMFERADREPDSQIRRALVTFVIAGGGFAGVELAGGLNDFARGMLIYYPHILPEEVQIILVHSRETILPELSESMGRYALNRMAKRGVNFKLKVRVTHARPGVVMLDSGEEICTETLVWTAGVRPNPILQTLPVELNERGAVMVDFTLAVPAYPELWALGDNAAVIDAKTGQPCPPTAQFALREAQTLARNIHASLRHRRLKPFHFNALGVLCVVGHHTACAEIKGVRFSGLIAWLMWRGIYLSKLPGLERKLRVLVDWTIELFFPRDIVQTEDFSARTKLRVRRSVRRVNAPQPASELAQHFSKMTRY